jgi:omega-amidase
MKITLIQTHIIWENRSANLSKLEKLLNTVPEGTDLVVLPETFTTGFSMNTEILAEDFKAETLSWMCTMAKTRQFGICGSFIAKAENHCYNRFAFATPGGITHTYDKRHLFSIGGENESFCRGTETKVFSFMDFRIRPLICYDLRFPVWIRNKNDYDLIICVANWPESRRDVWNTLLKARAIENQCYVAGVNRVGDDNTGNKYAGESVILDPRGRIIAGLKENEEGTATAEISLAELTSFRKNFPVWRDADDFTLNL